ncbi:MAG: hypothetical protein E7277_03825 [Lachnospiraceae bacterium]|jgi:hypothetical protein|nr:hypothetical protein [Lachnospiraceae bacterium]
MDKKIISISLASVFGGIALSVVSAFLPEMRELVNYIGATMILGGAVYLDQAILSAVYGEKRPPMRSLLRLPVFLALAIVLILLPGKMAVSVAVMRVTRAIGIAFLLLALLKFFIYTTMEEQGLHD